MPKKKSDKKIECFSASFNDILICQNNDAKPFIEVFVEDPENITQQNLGILAGILEITDESEDSSYIVNYLISVIKKEYYSKPKRGTIESFEAALKKANLALAKLAEHENIAWIGHTNAILLVIDKNNLHLSQGGNAHALLLRGKTLTDLSEDSSSGKAPNPLKTFTDIVSGRLEENDKLVVTTDAMFELFSVEEIKKSALKFSSAEFIQFLKTALVNESERAAALVIEIRKEEKALNKAAVPTNKDDFNAFSQSAFSKKSPAKTPPRTPLGIASETFAGMKEAQEKNNANINSSERQTLVNEIKEELAKNNGEFVDKKTGHIYIKGSHSAAEKNSNLLDTLGLWQDKINTHLSSLAQYARTRREKISRPKIPTNSEKEKMAQPSLENTTYPEQFEQSNQKEEVPFISTGRLPTKTKLAALGHWLLLFWQANYPKIKTWALVTLTVTGKILQNIFKITLQKIQAGLRAGQTYWAEIKNRPERVQEVYPEHSEPTPSDIPSEAKDWMEKYSERLAPTAAVRSTNTNNVAKKQFPSLMPHFSRLKNLLAKMDYTQRIYAALAIVCLFIVPYFLAKIGTKPKAKTVVSQVAAPVTLPLAQDKNVTRVEKINTIYSGENVYDVINLNDAVFAVSTKGVIDIANNVTYPLPDNFTPTKATGMNDLNFIFILGQDNRIISWSPVSKKFQDNAIDWPVGLKISAIGTYLTYLYVLDSASNQIYRYPRDTGGFGAKTDWLKGAADLSQAKNMALGENIYLSTATDILKFFQGKKQDFTLEKSATPIVADALYTKRDDQFLYILAKSNARIVKTDLTGAIVAQYYNADIAKATDFTIDEKNNNAYFSTASGVSMFGMN